MGYGQLPAENLRDTVYTLGSLLLRDAMDILSEDLDWRGGYERVLAALGAETAAGPGSPAEPSSASTTPWTGSVERVTSAPYARSERR